MNDVLSKKLKTVPKCPGCYLFKDGVGRIIYVGKAKVLANRVRSYFHTRIDERIQMLVRQIEDVEFIVTPSETDALIKEYQLIKQHKPWFNSQLKRDTKRPFVRIDCTNEYPSISIANDAIDDGAEYFGSFADYYDAEESIELINKIWRTQLCMKAKLPTKACLYRSLGKCLAPCIANVDVVTYQSIIGEVTALLNGMQPNTAEIKHEMETYIQSMDFEKAADANDKMIALEDLFRKCQKIIRLHENQDAMILLRAYRAGECVLFNIRHGVVVNRVYIAATMTVEEKKLLIRECLLENVNVTEDILLAQCAAEIFAEKRFMRIGEKLTEEETVKLVMEQVRAWLG